MILFRTLIIFLFLGLMSATTAQVPTPFDFEFEKDDKKYFYFNSDEKLIDNEHNATYYREASQLENGFWEFTDYFKQTDKERRKGVKENPNPLFTGDFKGEVTTYFENGDVEEFAVYDEKGNRIDQYLLNYENGKPKEEGSYSAGRKSGDWKEYYENGQLKVVQTYDAGKTVGKFEEYYESGNIKREVQYEVLDGESVKTGDEIHYFENGKEKSKVAFKEGKAQGKHLEFHENGELKETGQYDDEGNKTGTWMTYYDNGQQEVEKRYDQDVLVRRSDSYHKNGKLKIKVESIVGGGFNGPYTRYFDNGNINEEGVYKEGEHIGVFKKYYKASGKLKSKMNHETGEQQFFDENGAETLAPYRVNELPEKEKKLCKTINKNLEIPEKHKTINRGVYGFTVTNEGKITNANVLTSADDFVDAAAIEALNKIEVDPAIKDGLPAEVQNAVVIFFDRESKKYDMLLGNYYVDLEDSNENFAVVEEMPMFKGGENELFAFMSRNVTYPSSAKNQGYSGVVYINFLVDKSGVVLSPRLLRGIHPTLDLAALH